MVMMMMMIMKNPRENYGLLRCVRACVPLSNFVTSVTCVIKPRKRDRRCPPPLPPTQSCANDNACTSHVLHGTKTISNQKSECVLFREWCFNLFCATIPVSICGSLQSSCWLTACVTQLSITLVIMAPNDLRLANMKWRLGTRLREIEAERIRVEMEFLEDLHNLRSSFIGPWPLLDSDILLQTIRVDNILRAHNIDID